MSKKELENELFRWIDNNRDTGAEAFYKFLVEEKGYSGSLKSINGLYEELSHRNLIKIFEAWGGLSPYYSAEITARAELYRTNEEFRPKIPKHKTIHNTYKVIGNNNVVGQNKNISINSLDKLENVINEINQYKQASSEEIKEEIEKLNIEFEKFKMGNSDSQKIKSRLASLRNIAEGTIASLASIPIAALATSAISIVNF